MGILKKGKMSMELGKKGIGVGAAIVIIFALGLLFVIVYKSNIFDQLKVIEVSGMGVTTTVNCDEPFRLEVSGMNCVVTVSRGAPLKELDLSGMNSIVYIPEEMTPEIDISGMNSEVIRY